MLLATMSPAVADDESVSYHGATAQWTDLSDRLCARARNDYGSLHDYAIAQIVNGSGRVVRSKVDHQGGGKSCTGNLSIPEDRRYYLRVLDCTRVPGTDCGTSRRKAFFS